MEIPHSKRLSRKSLAAILIGNATEWYDWAVYAYVAPQISAVFFPSGNATNSLLATFAVFAVAFFFRPVGGLLFGSLGDRIGRKRVLITVILLMCLSSAAIGVLPSHASVGVVAPILLMLLRIFQGLSAGGEMGGATTYVSESTDPRRRGRYVSYVPASSYIGLLIASLLVIGFRSGLGADAFDNWGWRILFLLSLPAGVLGLVMRRNLDETSAFTELQDSGQVSKRPLRESVVHDRSAIFRTVGLMVLMGFGTYTIMTYLSVYLVATSGYTQIEAQWITSGVLLAAFVGQPYLGRLSDRFGRRRVMLVSAIALFVGAIPAFVVLQSSDVGTAATLAVAVVLSLIFVTYQATSLTAMTELFSTSRRLSGFNIGYNISIALFAGTAPFLSTYLIEALDTGTAPAFVLVVAAGLSLVTVFKLPETAPVFISREQQLPTAVAVSAGQGDQPAGTTGSR
ncbi:MFS transporter [Rhodococcus sp. NCIMB 12038]|uniref:MFS transporter n=1 Tax=Rhodococcus sp. NCIMB 12038 TaxID=933800 RepID=UPI000B3C8298|nr:MFS transporter [Rhodococcus sp. NCIMB 12038]OUS91336.1 hypothetical protein CA951_33300 [Rhodococcus sp. NCIMB 12038]